MDANVAKDWKGSLTMGCSIRLWLCALVLTGVALAETPPNIVLITLDTTRADRMGFLGSKRGLTPNLDVLAQQSAIFTRAYSQAPLTSVSHATILSGTYPQYHQVLDFPMPLAKELPYAPDILHARGYHTAAIIGSVALDLAGAPGFDRGFDKYDAAFTHHTLQGQSRYGPVERRAADVVSRGLDWLTQHPQGPFFLWLHLYDAHDPYDPPEPYKTKYASELYDGEIAYADSAVGTFLQELKARGLYDGAMIAVMADHGESLGAHGEDTHGVFLYDETIQVPLLIKLPRGTAEQKIDNRVELVDVMPTMLQVAGIPVPAEVQGESLLRLIKTPADDTTMETWRDRPAYAESDYGLLAFGWSAVQSLRTGKYLFVRAPRRELYDQSLDKQAEHNIALQSSAVADTLTARIDAFRQKTLSKRELAPAILDVATQQKLASLGYVSSTNKLPNAGDLFKGPDPKDEIRVSNGVHRADNLLDGGHYVEAIAVLQQLVFNEHATGAVYYHLGGAYMKLQQYDKAIPPLRKAVELEPALVTAKMDLGRSLLKIKDFDGAAKVFEGMVTETPPPLEAHLLLEVAYARAERNDDTIKECRRVLQMLPDHFASHLFLGEALVKTGKPTEGLAELQRAAEIHPNDPRPHLSLAYTYDQLGLKNDAERETARAESLIGDTPQE